MTARSLSLQSRNELAAEKQQFSGTLSGYDAAYPLADAG
jgi:hypothetical protein